MDLGESASISGACLRRGRGGTADSFHFRQHVVGKLGVVLLQTFGTNSVTETEVGSLADVPFDWMPFIVCVPHILAMRASRQQAFQNLDLREGFLQPLIRRLQFGRAITDALLEFRGEATEFLLRGGQPAFAFGVLQSVRDDAGQKSMNCASFIT